MSDKDQNAQEEIHSKVIRAGRRTYFFDVRSTKADDYYLTITESKKHTDRDGEVFYKKHKIYLYKEDFQNFKEALDESTDFIIQERGEEVISDKHRPHYEKKHSDKVDLEAEDSEENKDQKSTAAPSSFTDVDFEDI